MLEIPIGHDGPYTPVTDSDHLRAGVVYYRRGTQNHRAVGSDLKRIVTWFLRNHTGIPAAAGNDAWNRFFEAIHRFEPTTTYLLALDSISLDTITAPIHALAMIPWRAVIDFDPESDVSGFLSSIAGTFAHHRVIHRVVRGEYRVHPEPGTHWFFARGLSGRHDTLCVGNHGNWLRSYKQELGRQLEHLAGAVSPSPVVALFLWSDVSLRKHLRTTIEELHGAFGETIDVLVVSTDVPSFQAVAEDAGARFIPLSLRGLCGGVAVHYADLQDAGGDRYVLPNSSGGPIEVDPADWLWLSQDLELVHRSTGLAGAVDAVDYRRGAEISWRNLQLRHDCDRDQTPSLRTQVEADLRSRQTVRINLYHAPGGGGTTVGRRIVWDLHTMFPVGILKRCTPRETAQRISKVAALTESSVLLLLDGGQHSEHDIDDLYGFLRAAQTSVVLLQVLRRFNQQEHGKRQFWLEAKLSDAESDRFLGAYSQAEPRKLPALNKLSQQRGGQQRNAFFFGLTAFGKDFAGLGRYVERRIISLTDEQRSILVFIAIAHYYGQQSIPAQAFASFLGLPQTKSLDLATAFADTSEEAFVLLVESQKGEWRTAHHLIALELMQRVLAPSESQEREVVWRQNLSSWGKKFALFCRRAAQTTSDYLLELVRRVYIYRDNVDVLGTERAAGQRFSQLIEEIPSRHGKIELLRHLTKTFPLDAHFHAHLGRFLSLNQEYSEGLECIDLAISIQSGDHVLHHMRGMALRQSIKSQGAAGATIDQLIESAKEATESFEEARRLCPDIEHGYISEVQMLVDILDRAARGPSTIREVLSRPETDPFIRQALDRAEDLLDRVQNLYAGERPSRYALECRARLQRIYGDYATALQAWDNLLSRAEVAKSPVRRQIVWTILRRRDCHWDRLNDKEVERVRVLLEENMEEETNDSTSLRLWLRAIRQSRIPPSLDSVIEKVAYWKANTSALDAAYYLYVLHTIRALNGSSQAAGDAQQLLEECRAVSRFRRDRRRSFEWMGKGEGFDALVHQSRLGEWDDEGNFWESSDLLCRIDARVVSIDGPQKGSIELFGGVVAFFHPAKCGFHLGRDENVPVNCYLGFSYDGPRAWDVQRNVTEV